MLIKYCSLLLQKFIVYEITLKIKDIMIIQVHSHFRFKLRQNAAERISPYKTNELDRLFDNGLLREIYHKSKDIFSLCFLQLCEKKFIKS